MILYINFVQIIKISQYIFDQMMLSFNLALSSLTSQHNSCSFLSQPRGEVWVYCFHGFVTDPICSQFRVLEK